MGKTRGRKLRKIRSRKTRKQRGGKLYEWSLEINELNDENANAIIEWFKKSNIEEYLVEKYDKADITRKDKTLYFKMNGINQGDLQYYGFRDFVEKFASKQEDTPFIFNGNEIQLTIEKYSSPTITGKRNRYVALREV